MPKHIYLLFVITFLLGAVAGVVILLQTKTGVFARDTSSETRDVFTVGVRMYGGCMRVGCPSYFIDERGEYTYIVRSSGIQVDGFKEGTLPQEAYRALEKRVGQADLESLSTTVFTGTCPVTYDGAAYTFEIEYEGEYYTFDSCKEDLEGIALFDTLVTYFDTFSESS